MSPYQIQTDKECIFFYGSDQAKMSHGMISLSIMGKIRTRRILLTNGGHKNLWSEPIEMPLHLVQMCRAHHNPKASVFVAYAYLFCFCPPRLGREIGS